MKTMNILKMLAFAMLMPAMLLTASCSSDDAVNNENNKKKGYTLPVTINVSRQGEGTRTMYIDNGNKSGQLFFSMNDQLFVQGNDANGNLFAGTLTYVSEGIFNGTIATISEWKGTADQLFATAQNVTATLLPYGYKNFGFLSISENEEEPYKNSLNQIDWKKGVAANKTTAVEQFSLEQAFTYNNGFALAPQNAIVNCTYRNYDVDVDAGQTCKPDLTYCGSMEYGGDVEIAFGQGGFISFAIAVKGGLGSKEWSLFAMGFISTNLGSKELVAGKIYNWSNIPPAPPAPTVTTAPTATEGDIKACTATALVNAGVAEGGTIRYTVTNTNSKPEDTQEFSATVPTAENLSPGIYYVWYNVQGDAWHVDSEISSTYIMVELTKSSINLSNVKLWYIPGETFGQAISNHSENAGFSVSNGVIMYGNHSLRLNESPVDPDAQVVSGNYQWL